MSEYLRVNLSCTDPEIIASGSTFNQNTKATLVGTKRNEIQYSAYGDEINGELIELSKEHPYEKFFITFWNYNYSTEEHSGVFTNGIFSKTTVKPKFLFQTSGKNDVDRDLMDEFVGKIHDYLESKKYQKESSDPYIYYNIPDADEDHDGLKVFLKFIWETEDHRFIAENDHFRVIQISYENKYKENIERLKSENETLRRQLYSETVDSGYDDLPF